MKLSKAQQEVWDKINNGWELGRATGFHSYSMIQKGGIGKGGESIKIRTSTVFALVGKGLIERTPGHHFPTVTYRVIKQNESDT